MAGLAVVGGREWEAMGFALGASSVPSPGQSLAPGSAGQILQLLSPRRVLPRSAPSPAVHPQSGFHRQPSALAMEPAQHPPRLPPTQAGGAWPVFLAFPSMAIPSAPRCEIRQLVVHVYPDGINAYGHERLTVPVGRRRQAHQEDALHASRASPFLGPQAPGGGLAPQCRCSEALGLCRPGDPGRYSPSDW